MPNKRSYLIFLVILFAMLPLMIGNAAFTTDPTEDFESYATGAFAGGTGGSGEWTAGWDTTGTTQDSILGTGQDWTHPTGGDAADIDGGTRSLQVAYTGGTNENDIYREFTSQTDEVFVAFTFSTSAIGNNTFGVFCLTDGSTCNGNVPTIGLKGDEAGNNSANFDIMARTVVNSEAWVHTDISTSLGTTHYIVGRLYKSTPGAGNAYDRFQVWLNPEYGDLSSIIPAVTATASGTSTETSVQRLTSRFAVSSSTYVFDNIVIGDSWDDVMAPKAGITASGEGNVDVVEGGATDSYSFVLDGAPSATVTITADPDAQCDLGNGAGNSVDLTFGTNTGAGGWDTAQSITVTAVDDTLDEAATHTCTITHSVSSADNDYDVLTIANVTANITDDDTAGITANVTGFGDFAENASTSYTIQLDSQPSANVDITITPNANCNVGNGLGTADTLTFSAGQVPQTVTVTANDDSIQTGNRSCSIDHSISSGDATYAAFTIQNTTANNLTVNVIEDDSASITKSALGVATLDENPAGTTSTTYTLEIDSTPSAQVNISVTPNDECGINGNGANATVVFNFTTANTSQTVTVAAINDGIAEGSENCVITHVVSSADGGYDGFFVADTTITINDDDAVGITLTESGGTTEVAEAGGSDAYTLVLDSQPSDTVSITATPNTQCQINGSGFGTAVTLDFDPSGVDAWDRAQTLTITADDDFNQEGTHLCTVTHSVSSNDGAYDVLTIANVDVTITDNDTAGITITETGGTTDLAEGGVADFFEITLTSPPTTGNNVTITIDPDNNCSVNNAGGGLPADVVFTPTGLLTQTVQVIAVDDNDAEGAHTCTLAFSVDSNDLRYDNWFIPNIVAPVADNETASINMTPAGTTVSVLEGDAGYTYEISISSQPSVNVSVQLDPSAQCAVNGLAADAVGTVTFTPGSFQNPASVTITAVDDTTVEGQHACTVTQTITTTDPDYSVFTLPTINVTIIDDDAVGITVTESGGTTAVTEGGATDSYDVALAITPSNAVTITATPSAECNLGAGGGVAINFDLSNTTPNTVTVTAVDDTVKDDTQICTIAHTSSSSDNNYNGLSIASVTVTVFDNETSAACTGVTGIPLNECEALEQIYNDMNGAGWTNQNNWFANTLPCTWFGVVCTGGHVTGLNLPANNLIGSISANLAALTMLDSLDLSQNMLAGPIPLELTTLDNLATLDLAGNLLFGDILVDFNAGNLSNLANLNLDYNRLTASNAGVESFVTSLSASFNSTQTLPPTDLQVVSTNASEIEITWTPIAYTADGGYYEVWFALNSGGPYNQHGTIADKTASSYTVDGLNPNTTYYIRLKAFTPVHSNNPNALTSDFSASVSGSTVPGSGGNAAPVVQDDSYNMAFQTQLSVNTPGVLDNDSDADSDPITATLLSTTVNGTLALNADGSFTYTPNTGFSGNDVFTYRINDGLQDSASFGTVIISVGDDPNTGGGDNTGGGNGGGGTTTVTTGGGSTTTTTTTSSVISTVVTINPSTVTVQTLPGQTLATVRATIGLNFRAEPSFGGARLAVLEFGSSYTVLDFSANGRWVQLDVGGQIGWVYAFWVRLSRQSAANQVSLTSPTGATFAGDGYGLAYPLANMRVRSGPGFSYGITDVIRRGSNVIVLGQSADGQWIRVIFEDGLVGWSYKRYYRDAGTYTLLPDLPVVSP